MIPIKTTTSSSSQNSADFSQKNKVRGNYRYREVKCASPGTATMGSDKNPKCSSRQENLLKRPCTTNTSNSGPEQTKMLKKSETIISAPRSDSSLVPIEPHTCAPVLAKRQASRQQDFRIGGMLVAQGIVQVCIGLTDSTFHTYFNEEHHTDHAMHNESMLHSHSHDIYDETAAQTMRQVGHVVEGGFTTLSGIVRCLGAIFAGDSHYNKFKITSNALQALGLLGTATAATADWMHGHISHAVAHTIQGGLTISMTAPDIFLRSKKTNEDGSPDIAHQENRKAIGKKLTIVSNFADVVPSAFLAASMKSPFYAIESACNLFMGFENGICYMLRINGELYVKTEYTANSSQDINERVRISAVIPKNLIQEVKNLTRYTELQTNKFDLNETKKLYSDLTNSAEIILNLLKNIKDPKTTYL